MSEQQAQHTLLRLGVAVSFATLLSACSGVQMQMNTAPGDNITHNSGVAPHSDYEVGVAKIRPLANIRLGLKKLAVSDFDTGAVELLNAKGKETGSISKDLTEPDGEWYDTKGNLYVADYAAVDVQEYALGGSSPIFTYSAGLVDPVDVTADTNGNVFVADYDDALPGTVTEYAQMSNVIKYQCNVSGAVVGVALDNSGDVFASYNSPNGVANVIEYKGGLGGCAGAVLGITLGHAGGIALDKDDNLVACDQTAGVVDISKPPYTSVTSSIKGFTEPFHVGLNKTNSLLFVADVVKKVVSVRKYPSGKKYTTLGSANGLSDPAGVAIH